MSRCDGNGRPGTPALSARDRVIWAHNARLRNALRDVAADLARRGARLMAIKGIHLAYTVAEHPWRRDMADADALVLTDSFDGVVAALQSSSRWVMVHDHWSTKGVVDRVTDAVIDLHRTPIPPLFGRMRVRSLRARARQAPAALGPELLVPDPVDAACIAIAHFVKDGLGHLGPDHLAMDLTLLSERAGVTPGLLAERLTEHGLRRAGMAALAALSRRDQRWLAWLRACSPSAMEGTWAELMDGCLGRLSVRSPGAAYVVALSLGDSAAAVVLGAASGGARILRKRLRSRR